MMIKNTKRKEKKCKSSSDSPEIMDTVLDIVIKQTPKLHAVYERELAMESNA